LVKAGLTELTTLDLSNNKISSLEALIPLVRFLLVHPSPPPPPVLTHPPTPLLSRSPFPQQSLQNLHHLELDACEVSKLPDFHDKVFALLPSLLSLNRRDKMGEDVEIDSDDQDDEDEDEEGEDEYEEEEEEEATPRQRMPIPSQSRPRPPRVAGSNPEEDDEEEEEEEYEDEDDEGEEYEENVSFENQLGLEALQEDIVSPTTPFTI